MFTTTAQCDRNRFGESTIAKLEEAKLTHQQGDEQEGNLHADRDGSPVNCSEARGE
jgi:hypothetical protein